MKPLLKIINTQPNDPFELLGVNESHFFPSWHFHPEFEIMLVLEGEGMRFVGDSMARFRPGDLVFLGCDLPHFYQSDPKYYRKEPGCRSRAIVLYFRENFLGEGFWNLNDIAPLKMLFANSRRGIKFSGKVKRQVVSCLETFDSRKDNLTIIIALLSILQIMAGAKDIELLSSHAFSPCTDEGSCERMKIVHKYILNNYNCDPSLEQVSRVANMSVPAFCRYFKLHTNKTYTQFLNEIKVGNACKLLIENNQPISSICYETGFNNLTHFNSQFRRIMGLTPREYQQQHLFAVN